MKKSNKFKIGDTVEITKPSTNWKGVQGEVVNFGLVNETWEYLVRSRPTDELPGGEFWWNEGSLKRG